MMDRIDLPLVVVSIVNWNTREHVLNCLRSVHALTYPNFRIVVVDNDSRDDSVRCIAAEFPAVEIIQSGENLGFSAAHWRAYEHAEILGAAAVWLLNSDTVVEADALDRLVEAWRCGGEAIYGGLALRREASCVSIDFPEKFLPVDCVPRAFRRDRALLFDANWRERDAFRVGAVAGSSMLLPCALVQRVGWMKPDWFLYCEEIDYCMRLRALGVASILVPRSRMWHVRGASHEGSKGVTDCIGYYRARNEIVLSCRHGAWYVWPCVALKKLCRSLFECAAHGNRRARMTVAGVADAVRGRMGKTLAPEDFLEMRQ